MLIKTWKRAYSAGWRAGMSGASPEDCPLSGWLARHAWSAGWHDGTMEQLDTWLKRKRG